MGEVKEYYENYWNRDTDVSDNDVTTPERKRRLLETLVRHIEPGGRVLDLGCGGGSLLLYLKKQDMMPRAWIYPQMPLKWHNVIIQE